MAPRGQPQIVSLPQELILEIVKHINCVDPNARRALASLSCVCRLLRVITIPYLFRRTRLNVPLHQLRARIEHIYDNEALLESIQLLHIRTEGSERCTRPTETRSSGRKLTKTCDAATPDFFARFLARLANLRELRLDLQYCQQALVTPFRRAVEDRRIRFRGVEALAFPTAHTLRYVVPAFSDLRMLSVEIGSPIRQIRGFRHAVGSLKSLRVLEVRMLSHPGVWGLRDMAEAAPDVSTLVLWGHDIDAYDTFHEVTRDGNITNPLPLFPLLIDIGLTG
ncbi:hypothetical protein C8035_v006140 [Colletotrichum spinosum]|uniref:F-box domain-containing protein n=1 Tax=Colletotrichum spinosum TaxID=1347390 RepID=A0A4R8QG92_9PEZI|nr:hypothetical protein C8035_v006140 [Colletotrichum spinosum]